MPNVDKTGPAGRGMRTGRGRGRCPPWDRADPVQEEIVQGQESSAEDPAAPERNEDPSRTVPAMRGAGRGGIPRGCGQGFCGERGRRRGYCTLETDDTEHVN